MINNDQLQMKQKRMKMRTELIQKHKLAILAVILLIMGFKHPMHVTVTEVEYDKESKAIEMSMHIFVDDLEKHIRLLEKNEALEILELNEVDRNQVLNKYFVNNVLLKVNEKSQTTNYLGHEVEGEALWVFMEVEDVKKLKTLEITNMTLLELYDDQANLIHFEHEGEVYSEKLDNSTSMVRYDLADL